MLPMEILNSLQSAFSDFAHSKATQKLWTAGLAPVSKSRSLPTKLLGSLPYAPLMCHSPSVGLYTRSPFKAQVISKVIHARLHAGQIRTTTLQKVVRCAAHVLE